MNQPDRVRIYQEIAFRQINTVEYWFRNKYNLAPTDNRFLSANREMMLVEYWTSILADRYAKLKADKVENITLDDLLVEEKLEEELEKAKVDDPNDKGEVLINLHG